MNVIHLNTATVKYATFLTETCILVALAVDVREMTAYINIIMLILLPLDIYMYHKSQ